MKINPPVLFSQYDGRWANTLLGFNTDPSFNIYNDGCLLSDFCTVLGLFGISTDPNDLNQKLKDIRGFAPGSGNYVWGSVAKLFSKVTEQVINAPDVLTDSQMGDIKASIDKGFPVIIEIDYNPKTSNLDSHYVIILDYDNSDENNFTICDPLGGRIHSLKDYLGWFYPSARKTIAQYVLFTGPLQSATTANCLLPNTPDNQKTYADLVHGSSQWDTTVQKYATGSDPKHTDFTAIQAVVAGIQSTATTANNKVDQLTQDVAKATQAVANEDEKLALSETARQQDAKMYLDQIDALKLSGEAAQKVLDAANGRISAYEGQVNGLITDKHDLSLELAACQSATPKPSLDTIFSMIVAWIKSLKP